MRGRRGRLVVLPGAIVTALLVFPGVGSSARADHIPEPPCTQTVKIKGTAGDDNLVGTNAAEKFTGLAGNDTVATGAGGDCALGGIGDDYLRGGLNDDKLLGEDGNDKVTGRDGNDWIAGGNGNDTLLEGGRPPRGGNDVFRGGPGDDYIESEDGYADEVLCGDGIDTAVVDSLDTYERCENVTVDGVLVAGVEITVPNTSE